MKYFFRVDASEEIGAGHVVRCLTLAEELHKGLHEVIFLCREMPDYFISLIKKKGFYFIRLVSNHPVGSVDDAHYVLELLHSKFDSFQGNYLIIDHYKINQVWESVLKQKIDKIIVIDDLANREHVCAILLDANLYNEPEQRYEDLIPFHTKKLFGPHYALLRREFAEVRNQMLNKQISRRAITNILICFGGTDPTNETLKVINALESLLNYNMKFELTVIVGQANPNVQSIKERCKDLKNIRLLIQPTSIAQEMSRSHIAVCGGGTMTWERYCLGLPALVIAIADNQIGIAKQSEKRNIDRYLGKAHSVSEQKIKDELLTYIELPYLLEERRQNAMNLVDGEGVKRVARIITDSDAEGECNV
jgi:UDP-2,4-diacetamido-2,4,6-trideoxy-beta-L-altropyranose hydrolase